MCYLKKYLIISKLKYDKTGSMFEYWFLFRVSLMVEYKVENFLEGKMQISSGHVKDNRQKR